MELSGGGTDERWKACRITPRGCASETVKPVMGKKRTKAGEVAPWQTLAQRV